MHRELPFRSYSYGWYAATDGRRPDEWDYVHIHQRYATTQRFSSRESFLHFLKRVCSSFLSFQEVQFDVLNKHFIKNLSDITISKYYKVNMRTDAPFATWCTSFICSFNQRNEHLSQQLHDTRKHCTLPYKYIHNVRFYMLIVLLSPLRSCRQ